MGTCGFHKWNKINAEIEIGYDLGMQFWKKGYMYEALDKILTLLRDEMSIKEINACIFVENIDSIRLIEKLNFKISGTYNEVFRIKEYLHSIYTLNIERQ